MLGHHQPHVAPQEEPSLVDEDAEKVQELEAEFRVKELTDQNTGVNHFFQTVFPL